MRLRPRETLRPAEDPVIAGSLRDAARLYDERRSSGAFRFSLAERRAFTVEALESLFSHMQHAYNLFNERQAVCAVELLQSCLAACETRTYLTDAQRAKLRRGARKVLLDLVENPENPIARSRDVPAEELAEALVAVAHESPTRQCIRILRAVVDYYGGSAEPEAPVATAFAAARDALGAECPGDLREATLLPAAASGAGEPPAAAAAAAEASDEEEPSSDYAPSEASDDGDETDEEDYEDDVDDLMDNVTDSEAERELDHDIVASDDDDDDEDDEDASDGASTVGEDSRS